MSIIYFYKNILSFFVSLGFFNPVVSEADIIHLPEDPIKLPEPWVELAEEKDILQKQSRRVSKMFFTCKSEMSMSKPRCEDPGMTVACQIREAA